MWRLTVLSDLVDVLDGRKLVYHTLILTHPVQEGVEKMAQTDGISVFSLS